jgi:hypothetical protein
MRGGRPTPVHPGSVWGCGVTNTDWRQQAACQGADPNVFFPEAGDPLDHARRLCAMCPVLADCLADAVRLRDVHGFRAGRTGDERRALWYRKARQHGKPLLGEVQGDALRWSAAVRAIAQDMVADVEGRNRVRGQFELAWNRWTFGNSSAPLPGSWRDTVDTFVSAGLPMAVLLECVDIAMGRGRVERDSKFRYMCGIAWSRVSELQQAALQRVGRPAPSAAVRQGNGDEVVSSLFGLLPWCDQPDVWPALIAEFDQAHEDDEDQAGAPITYDHWSDFEKVFAQSVHRVIQEREQLAGYANYGLGRLTPEAAARLRAESSHRHYCAGEQPTGTIVDGYAAPLAIEEHPEARRR